ncbi:MAG: hypothetical protein BTN85_0937 [Candidatus Methanohalarchaeum thermophilum]|uniref:Maf-like protein n=1 Tax=Methanohalarchaeum thermophilum TaxID=1903181 RepID=A0A1Q6DVS2_METT1|nr:MAG: hypothetical protein BTN85_0937 [Candidatus Methanohalarchaeum thermophilum]
MKVTLCGSLEFTEEIGEVASELKENGFEVVIPKTSKKILEGDVSLSKIKEEKNTGEIVERAKDLDVIRYYFKKIKNSDSILVINKDKHGIKNYIGGNVLLEMGFAHVLDKKIYLWNPIPNMRYTDEIKVMKPKVIDQNIEELR